MDNNSSEKRPDQFPIVPSGEARASEVDADGETAKCAAAIRDIFAGLPVSDAFIGHLLEVARNIQLTRAKITRAIADIGADLYVAYDGITRLVIAEYGTGRASNGRIREIFYSYTENVLDLPQGRAELYLGIYRRFSHHERVLKTMGIGELMILRRKDYTDNEIDAIIELKGSSPDFKREDIRQYIDSLRSEELDDAHLQLDIAAKELESSQSEHENLKLENRDLNKELARANDQIKTDRVALDKAREETMLRNASLSRLQMQLQDLEQEKAELVRRVAESQKHDGSASESAQGAGISSAEMALQGKSQEIAAANAELAALQARRDALEREMLAKDELSMLVDDCERVIMRLENLLRITDVADDSALPHRRAILTATHELVTRLLTEMRAGLRSTG